MIHEIRNAKIFYFFSNNKYKRARDGHSWTSGKRGHNLQCQNTISLVNWNKIRKILEKNTFSHFGLLRADPTIIFFFLFELNNKAKIRYIFYVTLVWSVLLSDFSQHVPTIVVHHPRVKHLPFHVCVRHIYKYKFKRMNYVDLHLLQCVTNVTMHARTSRNLLNFHPTLRVHVVNLFVDECPCLLVCV